METLSTKVTALNGWFHCRLFESGKIIKEMACRKKEDIHYCLAEMLRWYDKLGGNSKMATASRNRWRKQNRPIGAVKKVS